MREFAIREYFGGDAAMLEPRAEQIGELRQFLTQVGQLAPEGVAMTALRAGRPVALAGLAPIWPGRSVAWVLASALERAEWGALIARMRAELERHGPGRIEAHCRADWPEARAFLERLGFCFEGVMSKFFDGRDHLLLARVNP